MNKELPPFKKLSITPGITLSSGTNVVEQIDGTHLRSIKSHGWDQAEGEGSCPECNKINLAQPWEGPRAPISQGPSQGNYNVSVSVKPDLLHTDLGNGYHHFEPLSDRGTRFMENHPMTEKGFGKKNHVSQANLGGFLKHAGTQGLKVGKNSMTPMGLSEMPKEEALRLAKHLTKSPFHKEITSVTLSDEKGEIVIERIRPEFADLEGFDYGMEVAPTVNLTGGHRQRTTVASTIRCSLR